jgi:Heavy metal binding domain
MWRAMHVAVIAAMAFSASGCVLREQPLAARTSVPASEYWCAMHPAVRGKAGDRCPVCQMSLVPVSGGIGDTYAVDLELDPPAPVAGATTKARFRIRDSRTGLAVTRFDVMHEKLFHLFVVSRDLRHFAHLHPTPAADGVFDVSFTLPDAGHYQLMADVVPSGSAPQLLQRAITTAGYEGPLHEVPPLQADLADKVIGTTRVRLDMRAAVAGGDRVVTFNFIDEPSGAPVTDLEPYLGAPGHLVTVTADLSVAAHSHPMDQADAPSAVAFQLLFPRPGMQRLWVQFQRAGRVLTAEFTVPVEERQRTATYSSATTHDSALVRTSSRVPPGNLTADRNR